MAGNTVEFNDANFEQEVLKSELPVLVDFWAPWCGPCRMIAPSIEALSTEYAGKVKIGKLNSDDNPDVSAKFGIRSIPTLLIFKNGEVVNQLVGALPKDKIAEQLDRAI
jgi:thioredoxin 1